MITTQRKGKTIGINRNGKPIGTVAKVDSNRWNARPYTEHVPYDCFGGVFQTEQEAVNRVAEIGQTPNYR